ILKYRRTEIFTNTTHFLRNRFDLASQRHGGSISGCVATGFDLLAQESEMSKVSESLVVQVARNSSSLTFGFVGEIQTRISELAIRTDECGARGYDSSSFEDSPQE